MFTLIRRFLSATRSVLGQGPSGTLAEHLAEHLSPNHPLPPPPPQPSHRAFAIADRRHVYSTSILVSTGTAPLTRLSSQKGCWPRSLAVGCLLGSPSDWAAWRATAALARAQYALAAIATSTALRHGR